MNDVHHPCNDAIRDFADKANEAKDAIGSCASAAPDAVKSAYCSSKDRLAEAGRSAVETVRKYPVETAVIAIGAGVLVWWLMTRRSTDAA